MNKIISKSIIGIVCVFMLSILSADLLRIKHTLASSLSLPEPNAILKVSTSYDTALLYGIRLNPNDPLKIDFLFDSADENDLKTEDIERVISYFMTGLTVSDDDLWVNLSIYEEDRILADGIETTYLGRDFIEQDYLLKQISSSLTDPDTRLGKRYWDKQDLELSTALNKIWIKSDSAQVSFFNTSACIDEASLKVLSEKDFLALERNQTLADEAGSIDDEMIELVSEQVNNGKHFSKLRQIYRALILAKWFKSYFLDTFYNEYFNKMQLKGLDKADPQTKEKIYQLYTQSFEKGVYSKLKRNSSKVKKLYYSGGADMDFKLDANEVSSSIDLLPRTEGNTFVVSSSIKTLLDKLKPIKTIGPLLVMAAIALQGCAGSYNYSAFSAETDNQKDHFVQVKENYSELESQFYTEIGDKVVKSFARKLKLRDLNQQSLRETMLKSYEKPGAESRDMFVKFGEAVVEELHDNPEIVDNFGDASITWNANDTIVGHFSNSRVDEFSLTDSAGVAETDDIIRRRIEACTRNTMIVAKLVRHLLGDGVDLYEVSSARHSSLKITNPNGDWQIIDMTGGSRFVPASKMILNKDGDYNYNDPDKDVSKESRAMAHDMQALYSDSRLDKIIDLNRPTVGFVNNMLMHILEDKIMKNNQKELATVLVDMIDDNSNIRDKRVLTLFAYLVEGNIFSGLAKANKKNMTVEDLTVLGLSEEESTIIKNITRINPKVEVYDHYSKSLYTQNYLNNVVEIKRSFAKLRSIGFPDVAYNAMDRALTINEENTVQFYTKSEKYMKQIMFSDGFNELYNLYKSRTKFIENDEIQNQALELVQNGYDNLVYDTFFEGFLQYLLEEGPSRDKFEPYRQYFPNLSDEMATRFIAKLSMYHENFIQAIEDGDVYDAAQLKEYKLVVKHLEQIKEAILKERGESISSNKHGGIDFKEINIQTASRKISRQIDKNLSFAIDFSRGIELINEMPRAISPEKFYSQI